MDKIAYKRKKKHKKKRKFSQEGKHNPPPQIAFSDMPCFEPLAALLCSQGGKCKEIVPTGTAREIKKRVMGIPPWPFFCVLNCWTLKANGRHSRNVITS